MEGSSDYRRDAENTRSTQRSFCCRFLRVLCAFSAPLWFAFYSLPQAPSPASVLVLINKTSPVSEATGAGYATSRNLPETHICRITTTDADRISPTAFESEILAPLARHLKTNSLQDSILYIATTPGVPRIIDGDLISVDSALALTYRYMLTGSWPRGRVENPYFTPRFEPRPFSRLQYDIYLVTRLPISTRPGDPPASMGGFYFDLASARRTTLSEWVDEAASTLNSAGRKASVERTTAGFENLTAVQGYASEQCQPPPIQWNPGALALVFGKGCPADAYIAGGAAGFGGFVEDPLADGYIRPQVLFPAWASGSNLAEAYYSASRYINWRQEVVGDPLAGTRRAAGGPALLDPETGLPEHFSRRKLDYLVRRFSTGRQAAVLLVRAETAMDGGDNESALSLVDRSLELDPSLKESLRLKSDLQPQPVKAAEVSPRTSVPASPVEPAPKPPPARKADYPAQVLFRPEIDYPVDAYRARLEGVVVVSFLVDELGQVMKADIVSGHKSLANAVLRSARKWRFEPRLENGRPVISRYTFPVTFKIERP